MSIGFPATVESGQTLSFVRTSTAYTLSFNELNNGTVTCYASNLTIDLSSIAVGWTPYTHVNSFVNVGAINVSHLANMTFNGTDSSDHPMENFLNEGKVNVGNATLTFNHPVIQTAAGVININAGGIVKLGSDHGTLDGGTIKITSGMLSMSLQEPLPGVGTPTFGVSKNTTMEFLGQGTSVLDFKGVGEIKDSFDLATNMLHVYIHGQTQGAWLDAADLQVKPTFGQSLSIDNFHVKGSDILFTPSHI